MLVQRLVVGGDGGQIGLQLGRRLLVQRFPLDAVEKGVLLQRLHAALRGRAEPLLRLQHQQLLH